MTDQEKAELANEIVLQMGKSPYVCRYEDIIHTTQTKQIAVIASQGKICEKLDILNKVMDARHIETITAIAEVKGQRNIAVAVIGALGLVIGAACASIAGLFR